MQNHSRHNPRIAAIDLGSNGARILIGELRPPARCEVLMSHRVSLLLDMAIEERIVELGLRPDRADLIGIAAQVIRFIADEAAISRIHVPGIGLKDVVLLQLARQINPHLRLGPHDGTSDR
jgi:exopolyphosphatase/pppGpp-phosphohydrolase